MHLQHLLNQCRHQRLTTHTHKAQQLHSIASGALKPEETASHPWNSATQPPVLQRTRVECVVNDDVLLLCCCVMSCAAAVLGHLGTQQLGAVSLASLATSLATYIFSFLVFLTTPRIAAAHAHGDSKQVSRLAAVGLWLAAVTGVAVALGMHAGADLIVQGEEGALCDQHTAARNSSLSITLCGCGCIF